MDWLNDAGSDFSVARRVLCGHKPNEPEMWMTLGAKQFPQFSHKGTTFEFAVPVPNAETKPKEVENYETAAWRPTDMTLLEFLRRSNKDGEILKHIQIKHEQHLWQEVEKAFEEAGKPKQQVTQLKRALTAERNSRGRRGSLRPPLFEFLQHNMEGFVDDAFTSLAEFAVVNYKCQGEKAIAAMTNSMLNDRYYGQWLVLNVPFKALEDFENNAKQIVEKVPERYRNFALCMHYARPFWSDEAAIDDAMRLEGHGKAHIETVKAKVSAQRRLVERYLSGELSPEDVVPSSPESDPGAAGPSRLTSSQKRLRKELRQNLMVALKARQAKEDAEVEQCIAEADAHRMLFASGPPGTGKTHVVHREIDRWKREGARVLFALPTGMLASEVRAKQPDIDVDTTWGAFLFHRPVQEAAQILTQYDLVVVDEVSMLTDWQFERIVALWMHAEKLPAVVLLGDFYQLPVVDPQAQRCELSSAWRQHVKTIEFREQVRCKSKTLQEKLDILRYNIPSKRQLRQKLLKGHVAWTKEVPEPFDIKRLLDKHANTTIVTCTCPGSHMVNEICRKLRFEDRHKKPLGTVPFDYEANPENYELVNGRRVLRRRGRVEAADTEVYAGMRVFLTRNMAKADDFVNGMQAEVQAYDSRSKCLEVLTRTGKRLAVHPYTEQLDDGRKVTSFPVRLGYACTVQKVQGMTLDHITLWLDAAGCRAAAYVALSRVQRDTDYLIGGKVSPKHFVPAH